ncbi:MAG: DeoR/GlpR family DNA-binding transcription regulator [Candidatus Limnocylindrales bacterium]|jgi:DeoR/GlpR family transcriptional regulator of sugar metabolism
MGTSEPRDVFARERQQHIARIAEEHGRARVADLAARFAVSEVTIRKDLRVLETEGRVVRAHGGALAPTRSRPELAFEVRERLQREEKERIGTTAAALVIDGESIALDASTTALAMARHLKKRGGWVHLTVITNGLRIASELAGQPGITVALPGGFVRWEALSVVGPLGSGLLEKVNIQKAFMGAAGFTMETGLSDATDDEAQIKRLIVGAAHDVVALVDHTKWGRAAFATFCPTDRLTAVVTDEEAQAATVNALRQRGILVHVAPGPEKTPALGSRSSDSTAMDTAL